PPGRLSVVAFAEPSRLFDGLVYGAARRSRQPGPPPRKADRLRLWHAALGRFSATARERGIRLLVCTAPSNPHFPAGATPQERFEPRFLGAVARWTIGRRQAALEELGRAADQTGSAYWHYVGGEWALELGSFAEGSRHLSAALELGLTPRADAATNGEIRRLARAGGA